jgi:hypothetical protein
MQNAFERKQEIKDKKENPELHHQRALESPPS